MQSVGRWPGAVWAWVRGREPAVAAALVLLAVGAWTFVEIADSVKEGSAALRAFDEGVLRAMRHADDPGVPVGPHAMRLVATEITAMGGWVLLTLLVAVIAGFLWISGRRRTMGLVLAAVGGGQAVGSILKAAFARERPSVVPHLAEVTSKSFPSGHSMMSAVVYLTLAAVVTRVVARRRERVYIYAVAGTLVALVGLSRVYLGVHYPSDVLAGWAAGLSWAMACGLVARWLRRREARPEEPIDLPAGSGPG
jgi:undecaprenyl-diphosphatase